MTQQMFAVHKLKQHITTLLLLMLMAGGMQLTAFGQESGGQKVTGKVTAAQGEALAGVSIKQKGSSNGATTDTQGNYAIRVSDPNATLIFSYVGHTSKEIELQGRTSVN